MIEVLGAVGGIFDILQSAHKMYGDYKQNKALENNALRMLAMEVEHNMLVLDACHVLSKKGPSATDAGYLAVARTLKTDAHLAILMMADFEEDEESVREHQRQLNESKKKMFDEVLTFEEDGIAGHVRLGDSRPSSKKLDERKPVGLLEASAFVVSRVAGLVTLASVADDEAKMMKKIRPRIRLRTIRAYERAIQRGLRQREVIPRIRQPSSDET